MSGMREDKLPWQDLARMVLANLYQGRHRRY